MSDNGVDVFLHNRERLIALACGIVRDMPLAEDLVQESWVRWQLGNYAKTDARPLFRTIVANLAKDALRRQRTERNYLETLVQSAEEHRDAERVCMARQELATIVTALQQMPPRHVAAFRMRRIDGLSYPEIARRLDTVPSRAYDYVAKVVAGLTVALLDP